MKAYPLYFALFALIFGLMVSCADIPIPTENQVKTEDQSSLSDVSSVSVEETNKNPAVTDASVPTPTPVPTHVPASVPTSTSTPAPTSNSTPAPNTPSPKNSTNLPSSTEVKEALTEALSETKKTVQATVDNINEIALDIQKNPEKYKKTFDEIKEMYINEPENIIKAAGIERFMNLQYESVPIGLILIITGFFLTFFGRRIFKAFLTVSGVIVGASTFLYLFILIESITGVSAPQWIFWLMVLVGAVSGAALFNKAWKWSVYIISGYGGFVLGLWILGIINSMEINQYIERNIFLAVFCLIGLFSAHFVDELVVISSSSLIGSFTAAFGYDMIHCVGFRVFVKNTIDNTPTNFIDIILENTPMNTNVRICMLCVLLMTIGGIYVQFRHQPRTYDRK